jgi:serine/threonine-protein kinase
MAEATTRAGAYRLVEHIASGGMGVVYRAERDDGQVRHQAAVKILRRGLDAEDQVRRFASERQILASLDHPNIARLIDAGVTDDMRPYVVMEYVDGQQIDAYCDERRLSVKQRVALIRDVAMAVDYAHRNLVVHRDLKPSNIFVTDDGQVKLLDFGIAKLLDADPEGATAVTVPGVRLMTPGYASPEQITGAHVTTSTDVYVLGLLLYELLTGTRAQETDGRSLPDIEELVVRGAPRRPSEVVASLPATLAVTTSGPPATAIAQARGTTPGRLRRLLRGDLDRIVGMALRKEPDRRYPSAQAFADDLNRYLDGKPVQARADSAAYRVGKFVRRRWPAVAAAGLFVALLVAYAVTMTIQSRQIRAERDRAQAAQAKAEEVTSFLVRMFQASDPGETRGDTVTARELLATGVERVGALDSQPAVQGQLLDVMGRVYQSLGRFDDARSLLERALRVRRGAFGESHRDVGDAWTHLGELSSMQGRYADAESQLRTALAIHEGLNGKESPEFATDLHLLGAVLVDKGEPAQGKQLFEEGSRSGGGCCVPTTWISLRARAVWRMRPPAWVTTPRWSGGTARPWICCGRCSAITTPASRWG